MTAPAVYAPDLMDRSRIAAAHPDAVFVSDPSELGAVQADLVIVDVARPGVLEVVRAIAGRVIAFARHDDQSTIDAAHAAGCDEVLARSVFFKRLSGD